MTRLIYDFSGGRTGDSFSCDKVGRTSSCEENREKRWVTMTTTEEQIRCIFDDDSGIILLISA